MVTLFLMAQQTQPEGQGGNPILQFLPIILLFVIFYVFIMLPQQRKQKKLQEMIDNLQKGDKIITTGGIIGQVIGKKENVIVIKTGENTKLEINKNFVTEKISEEIKTS